MYILQIFPEQLRPSGTVHPLLWHRVRIHAHVWLLGWHSLGSILPETIVAPLWGALRELLRYTPWHLKKEWLSHAILPPTVPTSTSALLINCSWWASRGHWCQLLVWVCWINIMDISTLPCHSHVFETWNKFRCICGCIFVFSFYPWLNYLLIYLIWFKFKRKNLFKIC